MKRFDCLFYVLVLAFVGSADAKGKPGGGCSDVPISMTFAATTAAPAAIWNDDPTKVYQNGVDGITNALIHFGSGCAGSHDATLGFQAKSKRFLWFKIPSAIPGSVIESGPAPFAGGVAFKVKGLINVRNITGYGLLTPRVAATFYTKVGSTFIGPDGGSYRLRFYPDDSACPGDFQCVPNLHEVGEPANLNQPVQSAWVKVTYTPRNSSMPYSSSNSDSWVVEGELVETGGVVERMTLLFNAGGNNSWMHYGQYSMPIKILIKALAALP